MKKNMTQNEKDWVKINSVKLLEKAKCINIILNFIFYGNFLNIFLNTFLAEKGLELKIDATKPQLYFDKSKELEK